MGCSQFLQTGKQGLCSPAVKKVATVRRAMLKGVASGASLLNEELAAASCNL
jgi:hypothetical protein